MTPSRPLVIGFGNPCRRDDAAGPLVARRLGEMGIPDVEVREMHGDASRLPSVWEGYDPVYLVDAVVSGGAAGALLRLDAVEEPLPPGRRSPSSHAFGVAEAVELARALGRLPGTLVVYGIEGADFGAGERPSPPVVAAVEAVVRRIARELHPGVGRQDLRPRATPGR